MLSMRNFLKTSLVVMAALTAALASAQDWGVFQGMPNRSGTNGDVVGSGPGVANLTWFHPISPDNIIGDLPPDSPRGSTIVEDANASGRIGPWAQANNNNEASDVFNTSTNPPYWYTGETASEPRLLGQPYDPRIPQAGLVRTISWTMTPPAADVGSARSYALYVWVPQGPTGTVLFPQRFYVYDVTYGNGQKFVDVVDTWQSGWIRLGNGGAPTNRTFAYNGSLPIVITLYNTVPRDENGQLLDHALNNPSVVNPNGVVYGDATMAVPDFGYYTASPTVRLNPNIPIGNSQIRTVAAFNRFVTDAAASDGSASSTAAGEVSSYNFSTGVRQWLFSLATLRTVSFVVDNNNAVSAPAAAWEAVPTSGNPPVAIHQGADYYRANIQNTSLAAAATVTYLPNVAPGSYGIELYLPGPYTPANPPGDTGDNVGHATVIKVFEGPLETDIPVNQTQGPGWIAIHDPAFPARKFTQAAGAPLSVVITNYSADPTDLGRKAFADGVRFTNTVIPAVNSTPIQCTANVRYDPNNPTVVPPAPQPCDVVVIAAEDGRIYCVDGKGNGDGTTNLIWTYPSLVTPDPNAVGLPTDPIANKLDGENGTILAEMPTGFNTSSGLVRTNGVGEDLLYIGANNGRVYCIEMAGRGDENIAGGVPGTTKRRWTFPDDYPSIKKPALGIFYGSVAFATTTQGPTIFAPDSQGRMYALDADGNAATRTTGVRWAFPAVTQPTLGSIRTTPLVTFNPLRVYFGTLRPNGTLPGQIWCLDAANPNNAALQWHFNGITTADPLFPTFEFDDFLSSPTAGTAAELGNGMPDTVFFANMNGYVVAFSSNGVQQWVDNELGNGVNAPLSLTYLSVFDNAGVAGSLVTPFVMVPTADAQYAGLSADTGILNVFGGRLGWGFQGEGNGQQAGLSVGRNWMYTGDPNGNLFAFSNGGGLLPGFPNPPGAPIIVPNNPAGNPWRNNIVIKKLTSVGTKALLANPTAVTKGQLDTDPGSGAGALTDGAVPIAFEWGQRAQLVVYGFPHPGVNESTRVQFIVTVEGKDGRPRVVDAHQLAADGTPASQDGYAVIDLPIIGTGPDGVPPGPGRITISMRTNALNGGNGNPEQVIAMDPTKNFRDFFVANPLGIGMHTNAGFGGNLIDVTAGINDATAMGRSRSASNPENLVNDSPNVPGKSGAIIGTTVGVLNHGGSGEVYTYVWDRSLMTELRGPGHGLDASVRVQSEDLQWMGGQASVYHGFFSNPNTAIFSNFEDLPVNFPNTSLDYPNMAHNRLRFTKDPNGTPENPLNFPVSLAPPSIPVDGAGNPIEVNRTMFAQILDVGLDVPKYQPSPVTYNAITNTYNFPIFTDSAGTNLTSGYQARIWAFVDSNGNSQLDVGNGTREASRSFEFNTSVAPDRKIVVTTPVLDLGPHAAGSDFTTGFPGSNQSTFNPRNPVWQNEFQPFNFLNDGNVNLLNVRIAKGVTVGNGGFDLWPLIGPSQDSLAYLNGSLYMKSDIDRNSTSIVGSGLDSGFSAPGSFSLFRQNILQKPRPGDPSGVTFSTNPQARVNLNNNITTLTPFLNPALFPVQSARLAVALPIGFPNGTYVNMIRVIDDDNDDEALALDNGYNGLEPFSDPTLTLRFRSIETRLTTTTSNQQRNGANPISPANPILPETATMLDSLEPYTAPASNYQFGNAQPAGFRMPGGTMLVAWTSNRLDTTTGNPSDTPPLQPATASANDQWRLYVATLGGTNANGAPGFTPLRDLDIWNPVSGNQWFAKSGSSTAGYPIVNNALFAVGAGETLMPETVKFGSPAFPIQGMNYSGNSGQSPYLAFIGTAQKQTQSGRVPECRLFLAQVPVNGGTATASVPVSMPFDVSSTKSRPFIVQDGANAVIFYAVSTTSGAEIYWTTFDGTNWTKPVAVELPSGFESANAPTATLRPYTGVNPPVDQNGVPFTDVYDVSFTGRLRGRPASEVFTVRLATRTGGPGIYPAPQNEAYQPIIVREALTADTAPSTFRAVGSGWNATVAPLLEEWVDVNQNGVAELAEIRNIEVPNTRVIDRSTGVITFDCTLGGKAYLDPNLGTVRLTSASPIRSGQLWLTYEPLVLRVSANTTSSYTGSTIMFDHRLVSLSVDPNNLQSGFYGPDYWARSNGTPAQPTDEIRNDRYVVMYNRGSAGGGQTARPYMKTMRLGIQLPSAVYARPDGSLLNPTNLNNNPSIVVTGLPAGTFFQVDPAKGRVYFEANAENIPIMVNWTAVDSAGNVYPGQALLQPQPVSLITETDEAAVPMNNAANETSIAPFLDPFDPNPGNLQSRRPGLIWMLWASTRSGNSDIYMQTLAPRFKPVIGN